MASYSSGTFTVQNKTGLDSFLQNLVPGATLQGILQLCYGKKRKTMVFTGKSLLRLYPGPYILTFWFSSLGSSEETRFKLVIMLLWLQRNKHTADSIVSIVSLQHDISDFKPQAKLVDCSGLEAEYRVAQALLKQSMTLT